MKFGMRQLLFNSKKQLPMILQNEIAECGLACVAMISNYLGHDIDLYALRQIEETSIKGTTLLSIVNLCKRLNLRTRALRIELNDLDKVPKPAILHWNMNHFVVLKAVKKDKVVIHDPATGVRRCSFEEVSHSFTGVILEVDKEDNFEALQLKNKLSLFDLIKNISGIKLGIVILVLLSLTIEVLGLISPLFIQYVTDNAINDLNLNNLLVLATGFAILVFVQVFTEYIRSHSIIFITNHLNEQFSSNVVNHILKLPLNYFEKRHKGDIQSRFQSIEQIQRKVSTDFVNTLLNGFMIIVTLFVMFIYSRVLTLVVLMALFLYISIRYVSYYELRRQTESSLSAHAKSASVFLETLQSMLPIKSFAKEHMRFNAWRNSYINALNADIKISRVNVIYETLNKLLFNLEQIIVLCLGAGLILENKFSIGMLVAYLAYRLQLVNKATSFIQNIFDYKLISVHLARLSDILFQKPEIVKSGCCKKNDIKGQICAHKLSFKYHADEDYIFKDFNIKVSAGEKLVITGSSGCGKTTLIKVMMGLLEQTAGDILIDGHVLNQFGLGRYREITASVMQDDTLMSGSIYQNISFFDDEIDLERVYQSAKISQVHQTILSLPMGYETLVGDMGSSLSGGQKQRILLARALYKQPKILFLDEASSHLDIENEAKINQALKGLSITQIVAAHREETIKMADRVINL